MAQEKAQAKVNYRDVLVINPGSTSTKIAVFERKHTDPILKTNLVHDEETILAFPSIVSQKDYRYQSILQWLTRCQYDLDRLCCVIGRGGMLKELELGGYAVNDYLVERLSDDRLPRHASTLGGLLARIFADRLHIPAFIYDAPLSCKINDISKITGIASLQKYGQVHVLNMRAMSREYARTLGKPYEDLNIICCHMGGGITCCAQQKGDIIDTSSYDEGPMSPERSGGVPLILFKQLCFDGRHKEEEVESLISGRGGLYSYLGTKDCREVEKRIEGGDDYALLIYRAMAYQVAKSIAQMTVSLEGKVDAILLTGGIAHSVMLTDMIRQYAGHLGTITVMPGEKEMEALAEGAYRMMDGKEPVKTLLPSGKSQPSSVSAAGAGGDRK